MSLFNYECDEVKRIIQTVSPNYPQLTTYEREWIYFYKYGYIPGIPVELEHETVLINPTGSISNAIPFKYKSAILKGNTKYRDIDTGDILDTFDETKNLELVSVKMPVLKTTGNNLFDGELEFGDIDSTTGEPVNHPSRSRSKNFIKVIPSNSYFMYSDLPIDSTNFGVYIYQYDSNRNYIGLISVGEKNNINLLNQTFTVDDDCHFIKIRTTVVSTLNFDIGVMSDGKNYEPYKSNILTTNEEVELRKVGNVQDELNLLTGELTQRIGEVVLDGSENWNVSGHSNWTSCYTRKYKLPHLINKGTSMVSDKMMSYIHYENLGSEDVIGISITNEGYICFKYLPNGSKPQPSEVSDYLKSNPITIQYPLETESIKTVDLTPLNKPYEGVNHYHLTSNIPCESILEVPVVSTGEQTLQEINNY